jgi:hypothetical protein
MIRPDAGTRRVHVGRINESDNNFMVYRDATREADDKAFIMKLQDVVRSTADIVHFNSIVDKMRESKLATITGDIPAVVQLVAKNVGLTENEGKGVLDHLIRGGDLSLFGLGNPSMHHALPCNPLMTVLQER